MLVPRLLCVLLCLPNPLLTAVVCHSSRENDVPESYANGKHPSVTIYIPSVPISTLMCTLCSHQHPSVHPLFPSVPIYIPSVPISTHLCTSVPISTHLCTLCSHQHPSVYSPLPLVPICMPSVPICVHLCTYVSSYLISIHLYISVLVGGQLCLGHLHIHLFYYIIHMYTVHVILHSIPFFSSV